MLGSLLERPCSHESLISDSTGGKLITCLGVHCNRGPRPGCVLQAIGELVEGDGSIIHVNDKKLVSALKVS